jgi:hypothetical protein
VNFGASTNLRPDHTRFAKRVGFCRSIATTRQPRMTTSGRNIRARGCRGRNRQCWPLSRTRLHCVHSRDARRTEGDRCPHHHARMAPR